MSILGSVLFYIKDRGSLMILKRYSLQDEIFLRSVVFAEEDRHLFTTSPWHGGFRWFRAENVVPIEHWQQVEVEEPEVAAST
jgi:hypothetical protein